MSQVYESVKPASGQGRLLWHALGAKTLELIHTNVHVERVHNDLETLIMDAEFLEELMSGEHPDQIQEIEIKIIGRIRKHANNPRFIALGEQVEKLKERLEKGVTNSLTYLKELLEIAREVLLAEKEVDPVEERQSAKAALSELFHETRTDQTPVIVERVVSDIDEIVRMVRSPGWQTTIAGERQVKQAFRKTLLRYQLHHDQDLFDRAYGYIKEYY